MAAHLLAWLLVLPFLRDGTPNHLPIRRPDIFSAVIANTCAAAPGWTDPKLCAAVLDVWAAYESGYGPTTIAGGCAGVPTGTPCRREQGAESCSPWMIKCSRVPAGSTLPEQAKIASTVFVESFTACPEFPFGPYAGGRCQRYAVVDFRVRHIRDEMLVPLPAEVAP